MIIPKPSQRNGFSLIELVIGIGIAAAITFMVGSIGSQFSGIANFMNTKLQNEGNIDQVLGTMVADIRSMGPSGLGSYAIDAASSTSLTFFSDVDKDGIFEQVRYFLATSTINKGVIKPAGNPLVYATSTETVNAVISNVVSTSTVFQYFDSDYTGTQNPMATPLNISEIRVVKVTLFVDVNPGKTPLPSFFTRTINVRNLRTN